jgi:hypothetical protein
MQNPVCSRKKQRQQKGKRAYLHFKAEKTGLGSFRLTSSIVVGLETIVLPHLVRLRLTKWLRRG